MKKIKSIIRPIFTTVIFMAAGMVSGMLMMELVLKHTARPISKGNIMNIIVVLLVSLYASVFFHIIIHEGGHYIFGKISGYRLSSFRIGRLMLVKRNNKLERKRFMIAGTGGQCLMVPPACSDPSFSFPCVLYNLGGIISNVITSLIAIIICILLGYRDILSVFLYVFSITGLAVAVINGVPKKIGGIANDGYNALSLRKNAEARRALWLQLTINGGMAQGWRLKDMPDEWFNLPEKADVGNPLICSCAIFKGSRYHDRMEFQKAQELYKSLLSDAPEMLELYKNELRCELMFYEIIGEGRKEEIDKLYTKSLKKYIKATSSYISRQRLMYAYELLIEKNKEKAEKRLKEFEKACRNYPYSGDMEAERKIIGFIQKLAVTGKHPKWMYSVPTVN